MAGCTCQYEAAGWLRSENFIHKVPANDLEALKSPLMGLLEKNRCRQFFLFAAGWTRTSSAMQLPFIFVTCIYLSPAGRWDHSHYLRVAFSSEATPISDRQGQNRTVHAIHRSLRGLWVGRTTGRIQQIEPSTEAPPC